MKKNHLGILASTLLAGGIGIIVLSHFDLRVANGSPCCFGPDLDYWGYSLLTFSLGLVSLIGAASIFFIGKLRHNLGMTDVLLGLFLGAGAAWALNELIVYFFNR